MNDKFKIILPTTEKYLNIPLEIKWDIDGRTEDIQRFEADVLDQIIGSAGPYEVSRYSHKEYGQDNRTSINYDFYFYNTGLPISLAIQNDWINSYIFYSGFSVSEAYYNRNPFEKSFFKLDFYDTPDARTQKNYFTIILPTQQGLTETQTISTLLPPVKIRKPSMVLDFVGDKEGFFIYWLRVPEFVTLDTFYMSAKFFDAKAGVFVRMMTVSQKDPILTDPFIFDTDKYFYRKVVLDYDTKKYEVFDNITNLRVGNGTPIKWYEYVNP